MTKNSKAIFAIAAAAVAGFVGGYFYGKKKTERKLQEQYDREEMLFKTMYRHKCEERGIDPDVLEDDIIEIPTVETKTVVEKPKERETIDGYEVFDENEDADDPELQGRDYMKKYFPEDERDEPFIIEEGEYGNYPDAEFECANLFYRGPGRVFDEENKKIDIDSMCGREAIQKFIDNPETQYVYVRNLARKIDWEIVNDYDPEEEPDYLTPRNKGSNHDDTKRLQ